MSGRLWAGLLVGVASGEVSGNGNLVGVSSEVGGVSGGGGEDEGGGGEDTRFILSSSVSSRGEVFLGVAVCVVSRRRCDGCRGGRGGASPTAAAREGSNSDIWVPSGGRNPSSSPGG